MSIISIFLLALALAADSFAASVAKGAKLYHPTIWQALIVAVLWRWTVHLIYGRFWYT